MSYTTEFSQGFYHALNLDSPSIEDCPYGDEERATVWLEGYLEGEQVVKDRTCIQGLD